MIPILSPKEIKRVEKNTLLKVIIKAFFNTEPQEE